MKMRLRVIPLLLIVLAAVYIKPIPAAACSCMMPPSADVALSEATAVFSGEVVKVKKHKDLHGKTIHFKVHEIWKGIDSTTITVFTGNDSASCGIDFTVGVEYLVYANAMDPDSDSSLTTSLCDRTVELANAVEDLTLIGEGQTPEQTEQPTDEQNNLYYLYAGILVLAAGLLGLLISKRSKKKH